MGAEFEFNINGINAWVQFPHPTTTLRPCHTTALPTTDFKATYAPPLSRDVGQLIWACCRDMGGRISRGTQKVGGPSSTPRKWAMTLSWLVFILLTSLSMLTTPLDVHRWRSKHHVNKAGPTLRCGPMTRRTVQLRCLWPKRDMYNPTSTIRTRQRQLGPDNDVYSPSTTCTTQTQRLGPDDGN